jgi:threonine aldolase
VAERDWRKIMWGCQRWLGSRRPAMAAEVLRAAADAIPADARPDHYGEGELVEGFERRIAGLLGKDAAVLLPSGTMAQQIALRLHCDRRRVHTVAFHPTCHLELHEDGGYAHLHGLKAELVGGADRLIELADLEALHAPIGALLLELPQREIGGRLPEWDDLVAQVEWARNRGAATHLDGARIWESAPYYRRPHTEIAALFDTVYVSLYKGLGGFAGCLLAGPEELAAEARVWRRRHGGTLYNLYPFAAAAQHGLDVLVPQMPRFLEHGRALAAALRELPGVDVVPDPPQTPLFHLHLRGDRDALWERALDLAEERRVWLFGRLQPSVLPGVHKAELTVGEPALEISPQEAAELIAAVVAAGAGTRLPETRQPAGRTWSCGHAHSHPASAQAMRLPGRARSSCGTQRERTPPTMLRASTEHSWRWRESNPRPSVRHQGFSGRSLLCFSQPRRSCRQDADGLSYCLMSRASPVTGLDGNPSH